MSALRMADKTSVAAVVAHESAWPTQAGGSVLQQWCSPADRGLLVIPGRTRCGRWGRRRR